MLDMVQINVTRQQLGLLEEAVSYLMPTKRGARLRELLKLRNMLCVEIAVGREEDRQDG